ncbi:hypothetical protein [Massilia sp. TS11]|uniref:hypothetical protein n=1 Tax=Massilia sp. TS11 TaxID=2908003 RepID=UPI001EDA530A|nr:hypothetical protein [Massilia sp. TS11]MCG2585526.1 hypothetical protein [Massilia sp. TS11]
MMRVIVMLAVASLLQACATVQKPVEVKVPVAVGCLGPKPARPVSKFGQGPYPGDKPAAQLALADAIAWEKYATGLEAAMAGCSDSD